MKLVNVEFSDFDTDVCLDFDLQCSTDEPLYLLLLGSQGNLKDDDSDLPDINLRTYPGMVLGLLLRRMSSLSASTSQEQVFERLGTCNLWYWFKGEADYKHKNSYLKIVDLLKTSPEGTVVIV